MTDATVMLNTGAINLDIWHATGTERIKRDECLFGSFLFSGCWNVSGSSFPEADLSGLIPSKPFLANFRVADDTASKTGSDSSASPAPD